MKTRVILKYFVNDCGLAWQPALKKAKVQLELLTIIDMLLMVEKCSTSEKCHAIIVAVCVCARVCVCVFV